MKNFVPSNTLVTYLVTSFFAYEKNEGIKDSELSRYDTHAKNIMRTARRVSLPFEIRLFLLLRLKILDYPSAQRKGARGLPISPYSVKALSASPVPIK